MQRSLRGMYCSLLFQMLEHNEGYSSQILQHHQEFAGKRVPSDWELRELEVTLQLALNLHRKGVCLFIDGLDEMDSREHDLDLRMIFSRILSRTHRLKSVSRADLSQYGELYCMVTRT